MKKLITIIGVAIFAMVANAQTNSQQPNLMGAMPTISPTISGGIQEIYDAALGSTNYAVTLGGGRATTGNYNLVFVDYLYNFNNNVGLVLGFDDIAHGLNFNAQNVMFVKGGLNLQAQFAPLKNWGLPNLYVTPFGSLLMSEGNGHVGQIVVGGANFNLALSHTWNFHVGPFWENRSGSGLATDRSYACLDVAISKGF